MIRVASFQRSSARVFFCTTDRTVTGAVTIIHEVSVVNEAVTVEEIPLNEFDDERREQVAPINRSKERQVVICMHASGYMYILTYIPCMTHKSIHVIHENV